MDLNMMDQHQGVSPNHKSAAPETYTPTDSEKKLLRKLDGLFQKAKRARSRVDYNWGEYYKLFRGRQWKEQRPSYRAQEVLNIVFQTIQSQVPLLTDAKPKFEFLATEPSDRQFADLMNDIAASDWQRKNWLFTLTEVVYDKKLYGTGLSCLKYSSESDEIEYKSSDPFYFYPDPSAHSLQERCEYVVYAEPLAVSFAKRLFPKFAKFIKADIVDYSGTDKIDLSEQRYKSVITDQLEVETSGYTTSPIQEVLVKTFYIKDDEVIEEEKVDGETGEKSYLQRLKYPKGRKVIQINDMIVWDEANEYDHGEFPYQRVVNYILPRQFWGISELEPLESPQRLFNKLVSYVLDVLFLTGNPIWVVDSTSGVDTDNLTNQPGLVVEKEPGSEVRREEGVQLQPYVLSVIDRLKEWFDQISGSQDITRGVTPGGVTAAAAIADLQNAAQTRVRLELRNLDAYLQDFGQQYVSLVMQFYTAPRVFRLTGKDGTEKYFRMYVEKKEDERGRPVYQANVQNYTENNMLSPEISTYELRGKLDVRIVTGSSLPFSKAQNEQRSFNLFDRGIIDAEEVLKNLEYPNWEAIMQRVEEKAARQAEMQAQQQVAKA